MRCEGNTWECVSLGSVCSITSSKRIFAKEYQSSGIPFYRGKEIIEKHKGNPVSTELFISPERFYEIKKRFGIPQVDDILLTSVGTLGVPWLVDETDFYFKDGNLTWLRSGDKVLSKYLYLWLNSPEAQYQIDAKCIGSTQKALTIETLNKFQISLPSLSEQERICSIIYPILDKIELNQRVNDNLEQQAQAFFQELFIDNACPDWPMGTVCDLGAVVGGSTPSKKRSEYYTEHGIAWITPKDLSINKSKFIAHGENDITELGLKNSSASIMPEGTVLFSSRAPIGYIAIAAGEVTTNQGFKSVVPKPEIATGYVYYFLKHNLPTIEGMASGSTFKEVSASTMKSVPAIVPDKRTLMKFNDFCTPIFAQQKKLEEESRVLAELRNTLLPKLMAGEIEVPDIYIKPPNYEICLSNYKLEIEDTP